MINTILFSATLLQGMSQLGNIVLFSSVWFTNSEQEQNERYFLLFSEWLIILSADTPYKFIVSYTMCVPIIYPMGLALWPSAVFVIEWDNTGEGK